MFTGIIQEVGRITALEQRSGMARLTIAADLSKDLEVSDSVSVSGACFTVIRSENGEFDVDVMPETIRITKFADIKKGDRVNLERSLVPDQPLGGSFVTGHVDAIGDVVSFEQDGGDRLLSIKIPIVLLHYIAKRGSVSIDGVNLTVADINDDDAILKVALIPHTLEVTTLGDLSEGDQVNLEIDLIARYVQRLTENI